MSLDVNDPLFRLCAGVLVGKNCSYCGRTYRTVDDAIEANQIALDRGISTMECKSCVDARKVQAELDAAKAEIERLKGTPDAHGIKPCPFCGGPWVLRHFGSMHSVVCASCKASGASMFTRKEAIDAWNRRGGE